MKIILQNGYPYTYPAEITEQENLAEAASGHRLELKGVCHFQWLHTAPAYGPGQKAALPLPCWLEDRPESPALSPCSYSGQLITAHPGKAGAGLSCFASSQPASWPSRPFGFNPFRTRCAVWG